MRCIADAKAVKLDPTHVNNYCNYGLFLSEEIKDYEKAEVMYQHALKLSPRHANSLYNYAVMLDTHCKRKAEAESYYKRAIDVDPKHSYALYNLAVLLEETALTRDGDEGIVFIAKLYRRSVEADSKDAAAAADCGRFLLVRLNDFQASETYLSAALKLDEKNEVAMYNFALLHQKYKQPQKAENLKLAADFYRKLIRMYFVLRKWSCVIKHHRS